MLTLLDYIDPPALEDAKYQHFKLPALRDKNVFFCKNGFFDDDSIQEKELSRLKFDWIVGNPPWKLLKEKPKELSDQLAVAWDQKKQKKSFQSIGIRLQKPLCGSHPCIFLKMVLQGSCCQGKPCLKLRIMLLNLGHDFLTKWMPGVL